MRGSDSRCCAWLCCWVAPPLAWVPVVMLGFTMSGPGGTYTLNGLHAGQYLVQAMDFEGLGYASEFYDNASTPESATAVTVVVSGDTPGIDFTLDSV